MDFINRGFPSFLIIGLVIIAIYFIINILPVALIIGTGVWGISWVIKKIKVIYKEKKSMFSSKVENIEMVNNNNFSESNVIDVEYTEIK